MKDKYLILIKILFLILNIGFLVFIYCLVQGYHGLSVEKREGNHKIGACYMTMNNPFYEILNQEISAIVEANDDQLLTRDPALSIEKQINQIYDLIEEGVSVLIITPVDWKKITPAIEAAKDKGIIVMIVDTNIYDDDLVDCTIVSDNYKAGILCANYLMEQVDHADIVLLEHTSTKSGLDRIQGFEDTLKGHDSYKIVSRAECAGQLEIAMPAMDDILNTGISFDTIFALNDPSALGAMAALEENGSLVDINVMGVDGAPEAKSMIKEGMMMATSAQFPTQIGQITAKYLYRLLNGEKCDKKILVPVALITSQNVDIYGTDRWQ